ncbi:MAG TPA: hypothetical protein VEG63_06055, partial [Candidatus Acidoferrales bacterium]|nr:hypothetical protein [Candidatus Acidoferrales bacterium]
ADLIDKMGKGDASVTLDLREILEKKTIEGDWTFEQVARTPRVFEEGDLLFGFSGGGPGYGDPLEREPVEVMEDLRKNIISEWTARNIYRVACDPERRKVDAEKTRELRDAERKARLARGKLYAEFERAWSQQSPPKEILQWYGSWPDAKPLGPVFRP